MMLLVTKTVLVPETVVETLKLTQQEQVQNCTGEEIVDMPIPQIRTDTEEVIQRIPTGRISDHVVEQTVAVQIPR